MQPQLCSRCKKNIATVFITRMEGDKTVNEGLCLKCAKSLGTFRMAGNCEEISKAW